MLKALKARLAPNTQAEKLRIRAEYRQFQLYGKRENISVWVRKQENMYNNIISIELLEV